MTERHVALHFAQVVRERRNHRAYGWRLSALVSVLLGATSIAHADRVDTLMQTLRSSTSVKARVSAALSLGKIQHNSAVRALGLALVRDRNRLVRAASATSLGRVGGARAIPWLRRSSTQDADPHVRKRALGALTLLQAAQERKHARRRGAKFRVKTVTDDSPQSRTAAVRQRHTARLRRVLHRAASAAEAAPYHIDASVQEFSSARRGSSVEIGCRVRVAISVPNGRLVAFVTGAARVRVPKTKFRTANLPRLRLMALEHAAQSAQKRVSNHLSASSARH